MTDQVEAPVLLRRHGRAAQLVLNRPRAINALTLEMVRLITSALESWRDDADVETIVLTGAGDRGLCAGGDIVTLWQDAKAGGSASAEFWAEEYRLNALIAEYPKPFVAVMDGIVLGGGIGLSAHASVRVVTERSSIGMPETGIGFLPDVGGTHLLGHAPGQTGVHLALTAGTVGAGDAVAIGFADHYVPSDRIPALLERLATTGPPQAVAEVAAAAPESPLLSARDWIDDAYGADAVEDILVALRARGIPAATRAADAIASKSPTSLKITLRAVRAARSLSLRQALDQEYRLALRCHAGHDFVEGVRAQVIDKDRKPVWEPATLADVTSADVDAYFAPLGERELGLSQDRSQENTS